MSYTDHIKLEEGRNLQLNNYLDGDKEYDNACALAECRLADIKEDIENLKREIMYLHGLTFKEAHEIVSTELGY